MKNIIAHRGSPLYAHENTLQSFSKAIEQGADFIEFDIRRTKDQVLIAHHDPFISLNSDRLNINELCYSELNQIAALQNFEVPSIVQIFELFAGKICFDIELKEENCELEVLNLINKHKLENQYIFTSFNLKILNELKKIKGDIRTGYLFESFNSIINIDIDSIDYLCPDFNTYCKYKDYFTNSIADHISYAIWTVNEADVMRGLFTDPRVDAVITNNTVLAVDIRNESLDKSE